MNICVQTKSASEVLAEKLANHVFRSLPEQCPLVVIRDDHGNDHFINESVYKYVFSDPETLDDISAKIADGDDPLYCQHNGHDILATQIRMQDGGYVVALIAFSDSASPVTVDVAEVALSQIELVASILDCGQKARSARAIMGDLAEEFVLN